MAEKENRFRDLELEERLKDLIEEATPDLSLNGASIVSGGVSHVYGILMDLRKAMEATTEAIQAFCSDRAKGRDHAHKLVNAIEVAIENTATQVRRRLESAEPRSEEGRLAAAITAKLNYLIDEGFAFEKAAEDVAREFEPGCPERQRELYDHLMKHCKPEEKKDERSSGSTGG